MDEVFFSVIIIGTYIGCKVDHCTCVALFHELLTSCAALKDDMAIITSLIL